MIIEYKALVVEETGKKEFIRTWKTALTKDLPAGDVLIRVHYSSLNYKDALFATGNRGVTRKYPHTPGIDVDAAGVIVQSDSGLFKKGEEVVVTSYDLG